MASSSSSLLRLASSVMTSLPKFTFDLQFIRPQIEVPSILYTLKKDEEMTVHMPGLKQTETEEGVWISFDHVPLIHLLPLPLKVAFEGFSFFFQLTTPDIVYVASVMLPEKFDPYADMNAMFKEGLCSICLPTQKTIDPFLAQANLNRVLTRPTPYCEMFARADLGRRLCEVIAHPGVKSKSFTAYKKDDGETIYFKGNMPGVEKMIVTNKGLCVWLTMPGFVLEDVEVGFEYDALIVEGKREGEHYIAGVRVPEGFCKENDLIEKEMQDGVFKAILPHINS